MNDFRKINFEIKKQKIKKWFSDRIENVKDFYYAHPNEAVAIGVGLIGGMGTVTKHMIRNHSRNEDKKLKDEYIYDRRHGHYIKLRRAPKQREWMEIDRRRDAGEKLNDIVRDMRLL